VLANETAHPSIIDCCVLHAWAEDTELFDHLPQGWREYVGAHVSRRWQEHILRGGERPGGRLTSPISVRPPYRSPAGDELPDGPVTGPEQLEQRHLKPNAIRRALLCHVAGALLPTLATVNAATACIRAANDWTQSSWLVGHPELAGTILVPTQVPEAAAAEIRRMASDRSFSAVLLAGNGLGKPFGHPVYEPIHQAAAEVGLPIIIRAGGDSLVEAPAYPVAAGAPGTEVELRVLASQALMTHVSSLIAQGTLARYPELRFLLVGGGVGWVTPFLWRMDAEFRAFRHDALWLTKPPSVYFTERFGVGTHPLTVAATVSLERYLAVDPRLADVLCYASGFPDREATTPEELNDVLPDEWAQRVLHGNAERLLDLTPAPERAGTR